jgi:hypothetical protein
MSYEIVCGGGMFLSFLSLVAAEGERRAGSGPRTHYLEEP